MEYQHPVLQKYGQLWEDFKQNKDFFTLKTPDYFFIQLIKSYKSLNFQNSHKNLGSQQVLAGN